MGKSWQDTSKTALDECVALGRSSLVYWLSQEGLMVLAHGSSLQLLSENMQLSATEPPEPSLEKLVYYALLSGGLSSTNGFPPSLLYQTP